MTRVGIQRRTRISTRARLAELMVPPSNPTILTRSGLGSTFARAFRAYPRADDPAAVNRLARFEVGTTAAMLKFVTNRQLCVDAGACFGSVYSIDRGLDGEGAVLGRDGQADFHQVLAVVG